MLWTYISNVRFRRDVPIVHTVYNAITRLSPLEVTIVIPVFNQASTISRNLQAIIDHSSLECEIIVLNDASEDETKEVLDDFLNKNIKMKENIHSIQVHNFGVSRFETYCDHFGIMNAKGKYIVEIQADMEICEDEFDRKMIQTLKLNDDVFMLSARGIMDFREIAKHFNASKGTEASISSSILKFLKNRIRRTDKPGSEFVLDTLNAIDTILPGIDSFKMSKKAGRLGRYIEINVPFSEKDLYVGETVMRGPIAFEKSRYLTLGGLNTASFFLGFDEHDLNLRARNEMKWLAAYVPISFLSPLDQGSMRKKRSNKAKFELFLAQKRILKNYEKSALHRYISEERTTFDDHHKR